MITVNNNFTLWNFIKGHFSHWMLLSKLDQHVAEYELMGVDMDVCEVDSLISDVMCNLIPMALYGNTKSMVPELANNYNYLLTHERCHEFEKVMSELFYALGSELSAIPENADVSEYVEAVGTKSAGVVTETLALYITDNSDEINHKLRAIMFNDKALRDYAL